MSNQQCPCIIKNLKFEHASNSVLASELESEFQVLSSLSLISSRASITGSYNCCILSRPSILSSHLTPLYNSPHGVVFTVGDFSIKSKIPWGSQKISWWSNCKNRGGVIFPRFENPQNQSRWVLI